MNVKDIVVTSQKYNFIKRYQKDKIKNLWKELKFELASKTLIVKPKDDGCSTE